MTTKLLFSCFLLAATTTFGQYLGQGNTNVPVLNFTTTTNVAGASTNTYAAGGVTNVINTLGGDNVSISWRFQCNLANTGNFILVLQNAVEDGKPNTVGSGHRWIVPANGVTEAVWTTNLSIGAFAGMYITRVENTNAAGITNSVFMYRSR